MTKWTDDETRLLHSIATEETAHPGVAEFRKASKKVGKSVGSCERRFYRVDWKVFFGGNVPTSKKCQPWSKKEELVLFDLKMNKKASYPEIAKILERTSSSCERQFQRIDLDEFSLIGKSIKSVINTEEKRERNLEKAVKKEAERIKTEECVKHRDELNERIVDWLVSTVKADPEVLKAMDEQTFDSKLERVFANPDSKFSQDDVTMSFSEVKTLAMSRIESLGMAYPKSRKLGKGTYVIVGDSHGKRTATGMFNLLKTVNDTVKPTSIIHVGHMFDDSDEISYWWQEFPNLVVVGMRSELKLIKDQKHQYDVVMDCVKLGNLTVTNQYDTGDFVKKSVGKIDPLTIPDVTVMNTHRHEMHSHCAYKRDKVVMSPGCLCDRHTIRTQKILVFENGYPTVRQVHTSGFQKYNKQEQDNARWENGLIIVEVDENGRTSVSPCRIRKTSLGFTTSFFDTIYGEREIREPSKKVFFNADLHCVMHDPEILDIQEQFCSDYVPDVHVNLGDVMDNRALNHHMGGTSGAAFYYNSKGEVQYRQVMPDIAMTRLVISRMRRWAKESYLIVGNHERFASDFVLKVPQLQGLLSIPVLLGTKELGISVTNLLRTLEIEGMKFIHGDVKVWGGTGGSKVDKVANNYGENTIMGNIHYPAIRSGCYSVPMSGKLDQEYNEVEASQWMQGFGYANLFENCSFITIVTVMDGQCTVAGRTYAPRDCSSWMTLPTYEVSIGVKHQLPPEWPEMSFPRPKNTSASPKKPSRKIGVVRTRTRG